MNEDDDKELCFCLTCAHQSYLEECEKVEEKEEEESNKNKLLENETERYTSHTPQNAKRLYNNQDPEFRKKYATQQPVENSCYCMGCARQARVEQQEEKNNSVAQHKSGSDINNANSMKIVVL
jgi:hypothetical protein